MFYKASQFDYNPIDKSSVQELSTLGVPPGKSVMGQMPSGLTGVVLLFSGDIPVEYVFTEADYDASGEDIAGWRFNIAKHSALQHPTLRGARVLIIND